MSDSQKVTQQKALTTDTGTVWLVVGGVIAAISLIFLWVMRELPPVGVAFGGIISIIVALLLMVAVRFGVTAPRVRLWLLAVLTLGIFAVFVIATLVMGFSA